MNKYKNTQTIGVISYITSYVILIVCFINPVPQWEMILFNMGWVLGIISFISNMIVSVHVRNPKVFSFFLILTGFSWLFLPIALMSYFGFPLLFLFIIMVPFVHIEYHNHWEYHKMENKI